VAGGVALNLRRWLARAATKSQKPEPARLSGPRQKLGLGGGGGGGLSPEPGGGLSPGPGGWPWVINTASGRKLGLRWPD
jgi:hypothetical protein